MGESCWGACSKTDRLRDNCYFKLFILKRINCGGSWLGDGYLGQRTADAAANRPLSKTLFCMGRTDSQGKCWRKTAAQRAFEFILSVGAIAFGVLGASLRVHKWRCGAGALHVCCSCISLLLSPESRGKVALAWLWLRSSQAGNFA